MLGFCKEGGSNGEKRRARHLGQFVVQAFGSFVFFLFPRGSVSILQQDKGLATEERDGLATTGIHISSLLV